MPKYFRIVEINEFAFAVCTKKELDCCQLSVPVGKSVYVAVDDEEEDEITVPLDLFEKGGE